MLEREREKDREREREREEAKRTINDEGVIITIICDIGRRRNLCNSLI